MVRSEGRARWSIRASGGGSQDRHAAQAAEGPSRRDDAFAEIIGDAPGLAEALDRIHRCASTDATVLISGETGTGKELVARALHDASDRAGAPLVKIGCAAIPESLFESELFGHERGAFTGANESRPGYFERANGGTLFLDDVDALPLAVQPKLLRAIQEGELQPLGGEKPRLVDVRLVAATNKDLAAEVEAGRFREDLYYRLHVVPISIPPLRQRLDDLPQLVEHFVARSAQRHGRNVKGFPWEALETMRRHDWPGNVRELGNVVERAVVLSRDPVLRLPQPLGAPTAEVDLAEAPAATLDALLRAYKVEVVTRALAEVGGNHRRAAELLGIHRSSLTRMIHQLGIRPPRAR